MGYLDVLQEEYPDPIGHFKNVVADMNKKEAENKPPTAVILDTKETLSSGLNRRKNLGYVVLSKIYHEFDLLSFFNNNSRDSNIKFSVNSIMKLLIFSRLLAPASKKKTFEDRDIYFETFNFSLHDIYHCLTFINKKRQAFVALASQNERAIQSRNGMCVL